MAGTHGHMIGKTISHYKISDKLGKGGMGVVYKAEDIRLGRPVALKFLARHMLDSDEEMARFVREAQAAASLDHPNICTTYEIDEAEGETFIAMAYVDGETLQRKIDSRPLDVDESIDIATQVAEGLREAHEKGIIHRDIKSANIMLTGRGRVKITDFGLAKLTGRSKLTKTATIMGTLEYMSPEQATGEAVDHRTDIWSLGVVLYEMLTGRTPFAASSDVAVLHKIMNEEPADVRTLNPNVPPGLSAVVARALAKKKENRYSTVSEFLHDIRNYESLPPTVQDFSSQERHSVESEAYARAEKRVGVKLRFYRHLAFYLGANSLLLLINLITSSHYLWVVWPALAWGSLVLFHWLGAFAFRKDSSIRKRMLKEELYRERTGKD